MKLISIIGYDRSGTTFLGKYISQLGKNIFFAGEISKGIEHYKAGKITTCSCGRSYLDCPVWGKILPEIDTKDFELEDVLVKIREITGAEAIIDSSKDLEYAQSFQKVLNDQHLTVHVKRNPKGVILSRMNIRKRRVREGKHPKPHIASKYNLMMVYDSLQWNIQNWKMEHLKVPENNLNLTYDNWEKELPERLLWFLKKHSIEVGSPEVENHVIYGDKGRMDLTTQVKVNKSWKGELNPYQKKTVDLITFPLRKKFAYEFDN